MKKAIFVTGPAGSGKTTLCETLQDYLLSENINAHYVNLDPATNIPYDDKNILDIRRLGLLPDVMRLHQLGPNGALLKCLETFAKDESLSEILNYENDFLLVDCPGQIEAYIHQEGSINKIVDIFRQHDYEILTLFALDSTFFGNHDKLVLGTLVSLLSMLHLGGTFLVVTTKMDLSGGIDKWDDIQVVIEATMQHSDDGVNNKLIDILDNFGISDMFPVDLTDPSSIGSLFAKISALMSLDDELEGEGDLCVR